MTNFWGVVLLRFISIGIKVIHHLPILVCYDPNCKLWDLSPMLEKYRIFLWD
uniref:Uncharacterized protein n=1 Tax=Rhizophora mucronata TaxID=61149 RepID=A0A2P2IID5_RHIMU